jgi:hypothetical protein
MITDESKIVTQPREHRVRLLFPFLWERNALHKAEKALFKLNHVARKTWACWEKPDAIPRFYQDEVLPSIYNFLFGKGNGCCAYFRVPDETANFWFKNGGVFGISEEPDVSGRPTRFEVRLAAPGIELFLSPHGAGVFSVTFSPRQNNDPRYLQELNYRLSQAREFATYRFRLPSSPKNQALSPDLNAPFAERLGKTGGAFTLMEWTDFLLQALSYRPLQQQFSVYSVTRFGVSADFLDANVQEILRPYLTAVAHVEEYHHVGSLEVCAQVLNPRHWAAVGSLGAAHLVSDQNHPPQNFDEQRLAVSLHKYFVPYLLSLMQRIALQSILVDARDILISPCAYGTCPSAYRSEALRELSRDTLALTVNGGFTEISSREVVNQYYILAQQGLRVHDSFQTVQRALCDAQVLDNDLFQNDILLKMGDLAKQANRSMGIIAHVQSKVEWLEVFFVSYYATALVYYLKHSDLLDKGFVSISLLFTPLVSGGIAFWKLRPDKLHKLDEHQPELSDKPCVQNEETGMGFLKTLIFVFLIWMAIGVILHCYKVSHQTPSKSTESTFSHKEPVPPSAHSSVSKTD